MQTLDYRFTDKSAWGEGPWLYEIDKKQWADPTTGLPCLIVRNSMGTLCGYVGVDDKHPLFGKDYDEAYAAGISAHGGLTFASRCAEGDPEHGICHRPDPGEPDHVWWLGFDCAHSGDLCPSYRRRSFAHIFFDGLGDRSDVYRDQAYVEAECASLAKQLKAFAA